MRAAIWILPAVAIFSGCHGKPAAKAPVAAPPVAKADVKFPETAGGQKLREFYASEDPSKWMAILAAIPKEQQDGITPAMLEIIEGKDKHALMAAYVLAEWKPELAATSPVYARLLPEVIAGLDAPNEDGKQTAWQAIGSAQLLSRMSAESRRQAQEAMARRFLAPVDKPIAGETAECWTRYILEGGLVCNGSASVPTFIKGLEHGDRWVRECSMGGLGMEAQLQTLHKNVSPRFPEFSAAEAAEARAAARGALPRLTAMLASPGDYPGATGALAVLLEPGDSSPQLIDGLFNSREYGTGRVEFALAALHPAVTPELFRIVRGNDYARAPMARLALVRIGGPVVPELVSMLAKEESFPNSPASMTLRAMKVEALPAMLEAVRAAKDAATRERGAECYRVVYAREKAEVERMMKSIADPNPQTVVGRIELIAHYAPVAGGTLPTLQKMGAEHADETVRAAAKAAVVKITAEQLPEAP